MRIKNRNWETILLINGNFIFKLKPTSNVVLVINFLQVVLHLCCSVEGSEIEYDIRLNRAYDPSHDMCIFDLPFGMCLLVRGFVRSRITSVNMTPKLLAFNKDLELECPGGVVLSIKTNKEDIIFFSRHDAEKKRSQEEKKQETRQIKNNTTWTVPREQCRMNSKLGTRRLGVLQKKKTRLGLKPRLIPC